MNNARLQLIIPFVASIALGLGASYGQKVQSKEEMPLEGSIDHAELTFTLMMVKYSESLGVAEARNELLFWKAVCGFGESEISVSSITDFQEGSLVHGSTCEVLPAPAPLIRANPRCKIVRIEHETSNASLRRQVRAILKLEHGDDSVACSHYECVLESSYDGRRWLPLQKHLRPIACFGRRKVSGPGKVSGTEKVE